jgi:hypothetical protein
MRPLGANAGATRTNNFPRRVDGYGQTVGDHARPRTDPDDAERLTDIYGSDGCDARQVPNLASTGLRPAADPATSQVPEP